MRKFYLVIFLAVILSYGCASYKISDISDTLVLNEPPEIAAAEPAAPPPAPEKIPAPKEEKRFSLSVRDADIRDILLLLSKDSGINIIADMDVTGTLSIDFSDLDLNSALYAITRQLRYTFRMDKGFIRVTRPVLETRSFKIDYITGKRTSSSSIKASMSTSTGSSSGTSSGGSTVSSSGTGSSSSSGKGQVSITTSGTSDFWKEMRTGLEMIIFGGSKDAKGDKKLVINELAGIVHITDYSDNMERVEDFLNDVEMSVSKQVMIQAHIIEVSLDDEFSFGINWKALSGSGTGLIDDELFSFSQMLVPSPETKVFQVDLTNKRVTALIDAMQEQGQVNVLSSPKISTMNNQRAVMKLTTNEVTWITTTTYNSDGTILTEYTNPQIDEVGLFLDVTPQINDSGVITMQIHPSITEKIGESISPNQDNSTPIINTRELDTMVSVNNGQTIVIAGFITDKIIESIRKVPFLGDIPAFGKLFQQISNDKRKAELVIFLTPYILNNKSIEDIRNEHILRLEKIMKKFEPVPSLTRQNSTT